MVFWVIAGIANSLGGALINRSISLKLRIVAHGLLICRQGAVLTLNSEKAEIKDYLT
jgi:hypothetical protein